MGEYGTPDIDIEEGYLTVDHNGRQHTFLYPKTPGSMYHLSKVHDSHNIHFATRIWGLRATDLNQGVVYGVETDESALDPRLATSFHYDEVFGTALNRFCVQAVIGHPLRSTARAARRAATSTSATRGLRRARRGQPGRCRRASRLQPVHRAVQRAPARRTGRSRRRPARPGGRDGAHANPRKELEEHYYNAKHTKLLGLGLQPHLLDDELIDTMLAKIRDHRHLIDPATLVQNVRWVPERPRELARPDGSGRLLGGRSARPRHRRRWVHRLDLARRLVASGDRVRILDDLSIGHPAYLRDVPHELVRDPWPIRDVVRAAVAGVDAIVHLAARAGIPDSVRDPLGTFEANVT